MNFADYNSLKEKAYEAGIGNINALSQLLHVMQAKQVATNHYAAYMREMDKWEKNIAKDIEKSILKAKVVDNE